MRHVLTSSFRLVPVALALLAAAENTPAQSRSVEDVVYFSQDWCPLAAERQSLLTQFRLTMSGCCVFKAEFIGNDSAGAASLISVLAKHTSAEQDLNVCTGDNAELAAERQAKEKELESERTQTAKVERRSLAAKLRSVKLPLLCMRAGELAREEFNLPEAPAMGTEALPFVRSELARRGTSFDLARAKKQLAKVGDSECHLFAAWGLPSSSNVTSTVAGTTAQHVYGGGSYVYAERGRITGMQASK